ncbi:alpha/beta hydrolase [Planomonospora corallina]|uniref:Alpha/beta hydrolase n=1 Tax=Planomonospora corallina TaxID=1806052 RepID=A0ABV8I845_9ACTN
MFRSMLAVSTVAALTYVIAPPPEGDRIIKVYGDLRTAEHVAVIVPGADTTAATFDGGRAKAHSTPGGGARALLAQARKLDSGAKLAVVAWLGYDSPATVSLHVATHTAAERGARALRRYVGETLRGRRVTLLCHSYGSVVCAKAVPGGQVTDMAAVGSPGLGVSSAAELGGAGAARHPAGDGPGAGAPGARAALVPGRLRRADRRHSPAGAGAPRPRGRLGGRGGARRGRGQVRTRRSGLAGLGEPRGRVAGAVRAGGGPGGRHARLAAGRGGAAGRRRGRGGGPGGRLRVSGEHGRGDGGQGLEPQPAHARRRLLRSRPGGAGPAGARAAGAADAPAPPVGRWWRWSTSRR